MNALSLIAVVLALQGGAAKPKVSLSVFQMDGTTRTPLKAGATLYGDSKFRIVMQTASPVQTVEFYVNDNLRESDGSTPYEFQLDTLSEDDGNAKLKFLGVTTEGERAEVAVTVKIDNGVLLGADAHVKKGTGFFSDAKYDLAIVEGRIALKADEKSVSARVLLAQSYFAKGVMDKAQRYTEDVLEMDRTNLTARELMISVKVQQAFATIMKSTTEKRSSMNSMRDSLQAAITARNALMTEAFDAAATDKNSLSYLDAAIRSRRFGSVVNALQKQMSSDFKNTALSNRYLYSLIMTNQLVQANDHFAKLKKFGEYDGYTFALDAVYGAVTNDDVRADSAVSEALLINPDSLGVRTAQAFIALKRNNQKGLGDAARSLVRDNENRPEAHYFAAALNNRAGKISAGRKSFESAIRANAADHDMYIEQGTEAISLATIGGLSEDERTFQYDYARTLFELALSCQENSAHALLGIALTNLYTKKIPDAIKFAQAATKASPSYAAGWFVLSAAEGMSRIDVRPSLMMAGKLDAKNLGGRSVPDIAAAFTYFNTHGRPAVLTSPSRG